ncbi:hypothetical protein PUN28_013416 [Cardiocondyla obscurior]|uniref:Uncharacterized protein n=1 Tax=Cardiocondyla obscurior TaxID=286306 RepID=A0AAW2FBL9_9HYME
MRNAFRERSHVSFCHLQFYRAFITWLCHRYRDREIRLFCNRRYTLNDSFCITVPRCRAEYLVILRISVERDELLRKLLCKSKAR